MSHGVRSRHGSTRLHPQAVVRATHGQALAPSSLAFDKDLSDAEQRSGDGLIPGSVPGSILVPGSLSVTPFADTIRPIALVTALPSLPDAAYPVGAFVYKTNDTPPRLYKNVADAWVAAIGPNDIQADSITAGQIAAGAITTTELAAGAITLYDENQEASLTPAGFSGAWADFIANGLYNSVFLVGALGSVSGSGVPYWTLQNLSGAGTWALVSDTLFPAGRALEYQFSASGASSQVVRSDPVPVSGGMAYSVSALHTVNIAGSDSLSTQCDVDWYDKDGSVISSTTVWTRFGLPDDPTPDFQLGGYVGGSAPSVVAPANARFARVSFMAQLSAARTTGTYLRLGAVALQRAAMAAHPDSLLAPANIKAGSITLTTSSEAYKIGTVTFATAFDAAPKVVASVGTGNLQYICQAYSISSSGFSVMVSRKDGTSFSASVVVNWIAVGGMVS